MATETESGSKLLEDVFQNVRRAAETTLKLHQEIFQQWGRFWPLHTPQSVAVDKLRDFQRQWGNTVSDLARKHREVMDKQYQAALESLEAAVRLSESTNPEEYRKRSELLCRKTIDCVREISETQMREFQEAVAKWTELAAKPLA